jgi:hypothetical protein
LPRQRTQKRYTQKEHIDSSEYGHPRDGKVDVHQPIPNNGIGHQGYIQRDENIQDRWEWDAIPAEEVGCSTNVPYGCPDENVLKLVSKNPTAAPQHPRLLGNPRLGDPERRVHDRRRVDLLSDEAGVRGVEAVQIALWFPYGWTRQPSQGSVLSLLT